VRVSREFKANFDMVARYYGLAEAGELELAKEAVRRSPEDAATCFAALGAWVRLHAMEVESVTNLPVVTESEIDAKTSQLNQARQRGIVRDVRGAGRNDSVGALEFRRAREGKVTEGA
jgi:hypothetical protein